MVRQPIVKLQGLLLHDFCAVGYHLPQLPILEVRYNMKRIATIMVIAALATSFSFADINVLGVHIATDGGAWQIVDGRLAQTDGDASLAGAMANVGRSGMTEYSFDVAYHGGGEDNAGAFGVIVDGFAIGLVWDPANKGGSGLYAEVYTANGLHEYAGITYSFEIPASLLAGISVQTVVNTTLPIRIRIDSSNGNVWVKDPRDATIWWAFTLGQALDGTTVGVGTSSLSATFGNPTAQSM